MTHDQSRNPWLRLNDEAAIKAMLADKSCDCEDWTLCREYVKVKIDQKFVNLSPHLREEAVQETMIQVYKNLPTFRGDSKFTSWLLSVAYHNTINVIRKQPKKAHSDLYLGELSENFEESLGSFITAQLPTPEEIVLAREELNEVVSKIREFLQKHRNRELNGQILTGMMEEYSYKEIAEQLGMSETGVGYIIRALRKYLKQKNSGTQDDPLDT